MLHCHGDVARSLPQSEQEPPATRSVAGSSPPALALGNLFLLDCGLVARIDRDATRLHRVRHLAHEINLEEAVLECGALDLHVVGQVEDTAERAGRDAL